MNTFGGEIMAQLTEEKLAHIADQSRLYLTDEEATTFLNELNEKIAYTEKIQALDTEDVKATTNGNQVKHVLREDTPVKWEERDAALDHAPEHDGAHFKVPTIMD